LSNNSGTHSWVAVGLGLTGGLVTLKWLPMPWLVIGIGGCGLCILLAIWAGSSGVRALWVNLAALMGLFAILEGGAARLVAMQRQRAATYLPANYARQGRLGLAPLPASTIRSIRMNGRDTVYDATYTYDVHGLRITPAPVPGAQACVLFYGDSFTLGEGLQDGQSFPAQVATQSGGRITTFNFGFHGYGPQQMLASLESGHTQSAVTCRPTHVVFETLFEHVARVAGLTTWSRNHPRYVLQEDGTVLHTGFFGDVPPPSPVRARILEQLQKSALYVWLASHQRAVRAADWKLYVGVVNQARQRVAELYPTAKFEVLLFSRGRTDQDSVLRSMGLQPHVVEGFLGSTGPDSLRFVIPGDGHPSALADSLIARFLIDSVIFPGRGGVGSPPQ
jgi:hypothetical protein